MVRQRLGLLAVLAVIAVIATMALAVACTDDAPADVDESSAAADVALAEALTAVSAATAQLSSSMQQAQSAEAEGGILVTGEGRLSVEPDLAVLSIGIEAQAETVSQARTDAAEAMSRVVGAVKARGLSDADIQTTSFDIRPEYRYEEIERDGSYVSRRTLMGYVVSNFASIKVRDLEAVGPLIDDVAEAGGDLARINGIRFTVEDPKPFMEELRREAFEEARAKTEQLAELAGVTLGQALSVSESPASDGFTGANFGLREFVFSDSESLTPISGGETELRLTVIARFAIEP